MIRTSSTFKESRYYPIRPGERTVAHVDGWDQVTTCRIVLNVLTSGGIKARAAVLGLPALVFT